MDKIKSVGQTVASAAANTVDVIGNSMDDPGGAMEKAMKNVENIVTETPKQMNSLVENAKSKGSQANEMFTKIKNQSTKRISNATDKLTNTVGKNVKQSVQNFTEGLEDAAKTDFGGEDYDVGDEVNNVMPTTPESDIEEEDEDEEEPEDDVQSETSFSPENEENEENEEDEVQSETSFSPENEEDEEDEEEQGDEVQSDTSFSPENEENEEEQGDEVQSDTSFSPENEEDEDTDYDEEEYQKLKKNKPDDIILQYHPYITKDNFQDVLAFCKINYDENGFVKDALHTTLPIMTKFEMTRILSLRTAQLDSGAKPYIKVLPHRLNNLNIAIDELKAHKIPFIIKRPFPDGKCEYWHAHDLDHSVLDFD